MMMRETAEEEPWKCKQIVPVARADPGDRTEYAGAIHAGAQPQQQATEKCRQSRCICRACREMQAQGDGAEPEPARPQAALNQGKEPGRRLLPDQLIDGGDQDRKSVVWERVGQYV